MKQQSLKNARESIQIEAAAVERMAPVVALGEFSAAVEALSASEEVRRG